MSKINTKALPGFVELLPEDQELFEEIRNKIKKVYEGYGFQALKTPVIERKEVLFANAGGDTEKEIYEFKKGDTEVALRYDLTVPLARYIAENRGKLTFPFKRYEIGKVYRGERSQRGRYREFYQCDIDIIDQDELDLSYDAEIIKIIYEVFKVLNFGNFVIRLNNRKILNGLFEEFGLKEKTDQAMRAIDKLEKIGKGQVLNEIIELGLEKKIAKELIEFVSFNGNGVLCINHLKDRGIKNETFIKGLNELEKVSKYLNNFGVSDNAFQIDLSIARGLDYYTGTVFEINLIDFPEIGSVCSGGRYDNLLDNFSSKKMQGVGASIGLNRLFTQLKEAGIFDEKNEKNKNGKVLIVPLNFEVTNLSDQLIKTSYELLNKMQKDNLSVQVDARLIKMKKKLEYANKIGASSVIIIGEDEMATQNAVVKNMQTGEERKVGFEELKCAF